MKRLALTSCWLFALAACAAAPVTKPSAPVVAPAPISGPPLAVEGGERPNDSGVEPFEIAMDDHHICVRDGGSVHCGKGNGTPLLAEPALGGIADAVSVSTHASVVCLVTRRGTVHCRGPNLNGELGGRLRADESKELVRVIGIEDATRVAVGEGHACVLRANGVVACWGRNESGQTGSDTAYRSEARELVVPTPVPSLKDVVAIAPGDASTCAVTATGETWCWGGALTREQERAHGRTNETPFRHASLAGLREVTAGGRGMCGTKDSDVICWGDPYTLGQKDPSKVLVKNVRRVRAGRSHACALTHEGAVICWGMNNDGELGRPEQSDDKSWEPQGPGRVAGLPPAHDLAAGGAMTCAITGRAEAMCWGGWPYGPQGRRHEYSPVKLVLR